MNIKLAITGRLSYYFCGSIALSIRNTVNNPLSVDLDSLTKEEVTGLARAVKTSVVRVLEGEKELLERSHVIDSDRKAKKFKAEVVEATPSVEVEEVKEVIDPVVEEIQEEEKTVETEIQEVEVPEKVEEVEEKKPAPKTTRKTPAVKK